MEDTILRAEPPSLFHWMACRAVARREDNASARLRTLCFGAAAFVLATLRAKAGGADRNRTCDLLIANETLYQLSYDPIHVNHNKFCHKNRRAQPLSECASVRIGCLCVLIVCFCSTNCRIDSNFEARMTEEQMIRLNKFIKS